MQVHYLKLLLILTFVALSTKVYPSSLQKDSMPYDTVQRAFQILTDSNCLYAHGEQPSWASRPSIGTLAIDYLITKREDTKITKILDGHNNTGKIYAIEALIVLANKDSLSLSIEDKMKIKSIIKEDFGFSVGRGCILGHTSSKEYFGGRKLRRLLRKQGIKI